MRRVPLARSWLRIGPRKPTPVLDQYKRDCQFDEILFYTGVRLLANGGMQTMQWGIQEPPASVHHIFSGQNRRPDYLSNLIGVNLEGHDGRHFGTRGEGNRFTVLCLMAKFLKSQKIGNSWEFHYDELHDACGHNLLPTIESVSFADGWLEKQRLELHKVISDIESE